MDYQVPPTPIELEFLTTESRLPVPLNIFDDAVLEGPENFILFLTVPANPVPGYGLGRISSTTISILDNDGNLLIEGLSQSGIECGKLSKKLIDKNRLKTILKNMKFEMYAQTSQRDKKLAMSCTLQNSLIYFDLDNGH